RTERVESPGGSALIDGLRPPSRLAGDALARTRVDREIEERELPIEALLENEDRREQRVRSADAPPHHLAVALADPARLVLGIGFAAGVRDVPECIGVRALERARARARPRRVV